MPRFFAHSVDAREKVQWQTLPEHSIAVANLAGEFGASIGIGRIAYIAGLLHDLGKYNRAFQAYIDGQGASVDHSTAGAWWIRELAKAAMPLDRLMADIAAYAIAGHHVGLPDRLGGPASLDERLRSYVDAIDPLWRSELAPEFSALVPSLKWVRIDKVDPLSTQKAAFQLATLGRFVFSTLVDADFRDTERFYAGIEGYEIDRTWPRLTDRLDALVARFDTYMDAKSSVDTPLNRLRAGILRHARGKADQSPGFFTLTVPTGGGKTLASLGFALDHARRHGFRRIIFAIPFAGGADRNLPKRWVTACSDPTA